MSFVSRLRNAGKKATAALAVVATAASVMVAGTGVASANPREALRADATGTCEWDAVQYWVQRCDVFSPSMGRNIPVQIQPAARGGNAALYLLDGMRATDTENAWTHFSNAPAKFVDNNITLVMPVGGAGSFYIDWNSPATFLPGGVVYRWETFLANELPTYLEQNFGVARNNNSVAGLSMGGTAALNLAAKHTDQFRQALSYSGVLTMNSPGMYPLLAIALLQVGGFNINSMYGGYISPARFENDPFWNMDGLRGKDVYVSAASGIPDLPDLSAPQYFADGAALELLSRESTLVWEAKARLTGINVTSDYPILGIHSWAQFDSQLSKTHDRILNVMNAW
ncbi:alpha/beta hydrolase family protein [Corynebacterium sp. sy039]|uniref:alpha/beta hydrolase n=1 Tax=Corynebacterium sp. sy039 TaxID=2599641 RepID=UPI0011B40EF0|nr:alpha/beta hydrolase family protein [Corynebacterium sp. sy039]QDZ41940.1 esterase family protein [Corynebacterium sp. sy039]